MFGNSKQFTTHDEATYNTWVPTCFTVGAASSAHSQTTPPKDFAIDVVPLKHQQSLYLSCNNFANG